MEQFCEFRVDEEFASLLFRGSEGTLLGTSIRKVIISTEDERYFKVSQLQDELRSKKKKPFYYGWNYIYRYTKDEIRDAALFQLNCIKFEPAGSLCGTEYDHSAACSECGVPRKLSTDLRLDLRKAPKTKDIACTIAGDEWIVTQRLAELLVDAKLSGFDLQRVRHKARYDEDAIDLRTIPSGRELIRRGKAAGFAHGSPEFDYWLNKPQQHRLWEQAIAEQGERKEKRVKLRGKPMPVWYQLVVTSQPVGCVPPTRFGNGPFDDDPEGRYKCPLGHVAGLNILSEVSVSKADYDGSDLCVTREHIGWPIPPARREPGTGGHYPSPLLLMSPRFREMLVANKIKGWHSEVAYLR